MDLNKGYEMNIRSVLFYFLLIGLAVSDHTLLSIAFMRLDSYLDYMILGRIEGFEYLSSVRRESSGHESIQRYGSYRILFRCSRM